MSKKQPQHAFALPAFPLRALHNPVDDEQAVAPSIQDKALHSRNTIRFQIPISSHRAMMNHVPNVIHSHEPEPLAQLAKQVQEPATRKVAPASPIPTVSPSAYQKQNNPQPQ
ncbi:TPA: hypothetical protein ACXJUV_000968 [Serratia marcescens]